MMRYMIARMTTPMESYEIEKASYERVLAAGRQWQRLTDAEDKLELLIENYIEFEESLLHIALKEMVSQPIGLVRPYEWEKGRGLLRVVNRRLANLVTAGKLCEDQLGQDVKDLEWLSEENREEYERNRLELLKQNFGFSIMRKLRHHVQHRQLPITGLDVGGNRNSPDEPFEYRAIGRIDVSRLREDPKFSQSAREELEKWGQHVAISPLVREYIEGIGQLYETYRAIARDAAAMARGELTETLANAREKFSAARPTITLLKEDSDGTLIPDLQIFEDQIEYRRKLMRNNSRIRMLSRDFVSSYSTLEDSR